MTNARQLDLFAHKTDAARIVSPVPLSPPPPSLSSLPDRVRTIALHRPYAGFVAAGLKTFETRTWPYPYEPGWVLIHESKTIDREAMVRLGDLATLHVGTGGRAIVLVWIAGCRPMTPADEEKAMVGWREERWVWEVAARHPLITPIPMTGRQKWWSTSREEVLAALTPAT